MANDIKQSSPWVHFVNELKALFSKDPEVHIQYEDGAYEVILRVDNQDKADALSKLISPEVIFGNVHFLVKIIPANISLENLAGIFNDAFSGNPAFSHFAHSTSLGYNYALFSSTPAQFYDDNLANPSGVKTMLMEDIAKDVLTGVEGIFYTTKCDISNEES